MKTSTQTKPKSSFVPVNSGLLQRKCACGNSAGLTGECSKCQSEKTILQRRASNQDEVSEVPPIVHEVLNSPGQPLDAETRTFMEAHFGHNFSRVRVHTDAESAESAQAVSALAYTVGRDVVFGAGQYVPQTIAGQQIIAHELAHVLQQGDALVSLGALHIGATENVYEHEADQAAESILKGQTVPISTAPVLLQRQPSHPGRQRPNVVEREMVSQAEKKRLLILDSAINQLDPLFEAMNRQRANEPTRPYQVQPPISDAMRVLGLGNPRIDRDTAEGMGTIWYITSAFQYLEMNRNGSFADLQIGDSKECTHPKGVLYGIETSGGTGEQKPIVLCPAYFGARPECQAFILMHEYFHKVGLIGHGEISLASGADSARDELIRRGYKPGYRVESPSALATFAWVLATGHDPECSEQSESSSIKGWPTNPQGSVV